VGITAAGGAWDSALGALLLFTTNVLAIVVVGGVLYSLLGLLPEQPGAARMRRRPVYSVVAAAGVLVVLALAVVTFRTVQLQERQAAAAEVARAWAERNGETFVVTRFQGDALIVLVEGDADGSADDELLTLLESAVPRGTPVEVNRVPGQRRRLGEVR
jgi:uncharacterized membrane protein